MAIVNLKQVTYSYPLTDNARAFQSGSSSQGRRVPCDYRSERRRQVTLCYTMAGFIPHFFKGELDGSVKVAGIETKSSTLSQWVLNVGLVFQNPFNQISGAKYTVYEEIAFGLENLGVPRDEIKSRVDQALTLTGIGDLADRSPYSLSGGQQQRVALNIDPGHATESACP